MDLYHHSAPPFTQWIVADGLLREKFVVVDIGCQGGEHPRWSLLGDNVEFFGFDAISEAIEALRSSSKPGRTYFEMALGDTDGEQEFFVSGNTFSSSFFGGDSSAASGHSEIKRGARKVPMRRMDTLFAQGALPRADYLKLDCEGYEPYILRGARAYLAESNPICVSTETGFATSEEFPHSQFHTINEILSQFKLRVFDLNIVRSSRPAYAEALRARPWREPDIYSEVPHLNVGAPGSLDVVFCRDFVTERAGGATGETPSVDTIIKTMINFELHGLMDCAYEIGVAFEDRLKERLDVQKALSLLLTRAPHARNTVDVVNCLSMIAKLRTEVLELRSSRGREPSQIVPNPADVQNARLSPEANIMEQMLQMQRDIAELKQALSDHPGPLALFRGAAGRFKHILSDKRGG